MSVADPVAFALEEGLLEEPERHMALELKDLPMEVEVKGYIKKARLRRTMPSELPGVGRHEPVKATVKKAEKESSKYSKDSVERAVAYGIFKYKRQLCELEQKKLKRPGTAMSRPRP